MRNINAGTKHPNPAPHKILKEQKFCCGFVDEQNRNKIHQLPKGNEQN